MLIILKNENDNEIKQNYELEYDIEDKKYLDFKKESMTKEFCEMYQSWRTFKEKNYPWCLWNNCMNYHLYIMLSSFPVFNGTYYYEYEVFSLGFGESIVFGWTSKMSHLNCSETSFLKNDQTLVYKESYFGKNYVFGCLVKTDEKTVVFFKNGEKVLETINENFFNCTPIFAFAIVSQFQRVFINFGQSSFKHLPNEQFETFHLMTIKNNQSFLFKKDSNFEWMCKYDKPDRIVYLYEYTQNKLVFPICFRDFIQLNFDLIVQQIENMINTNENFLFITNTVITKLNKEKNTNILSRLVQSLVENTGRNIKSNKKLVFYYFVAFVFKKLFLYHAFRTSFHSILLHYLKALQFTKNNNWLENNKKIETFCFILLVIFVKSPEHICRPFSCENLKKECVNFLCNVFLCISERYTEMYAYVALKTLFYKNDKKINNQLQFFSANLFHKKIQIVESWAINKTNEFEIVKNARKNTLRLQLYLCTYAAFHNRLNTTDSTLESVETDFNVVTFSDLATNDSPVLDHENAPYLNLKVKHRHIELSPSRRMARNDYESLATVRSAFTIETNRFYFEVTILTIGEMRIGLAAEKMDIDAVAVGENDLSIGFDGFNQCVWMNKRQYWFKTVCPPWEAGDVIGVFIDVFSRSVVFGINGQPVELLENPFDLSENTKDDLAKYERDLIRHQGQYDSFIFSEVSFCAAVSLGFLQQCYCNFECTEIPSKFLD